ncbi:MAG: hypothetical protein WCS46_05780 [Bacteroidales bacterium]
MPIVEFGLMPILESGLMPASDNFQVIVGVFGQPIKKFSTFAGVLKIQHSFCNEENCKKRDHANRWCYISCSIGFVAFCLRECKFVSGYCCCFVAVLRLLNFAEYQKGTKKAPLFLGCFFYASQSVRRTHCSFS